MAVVKRAPQRQATIPVTTPASVLGLNTVDPLYHMDPAYGLSIQNFIATPQGLSMRMGYRNWATNLPTEVTTLLTYNNKIAGSSKMFAVSGDSIYDVTSGGDMSAATPVVTGLTAASPYWQSTSQTYANSSATYMVAVNGRDFPLMFDGSNWTTCSQVTTPSAPGEFALNDYAGNGINIKNFKDVTIHQQRLWFVANQSTKGYYCGIGSVGGSLYPFEFGTYFRRGGSLRKLAVWTIDSGAGSANMLVAFSTKGDAVVFQGTDPATASTWSLVGSYQLGSPIGQRSTTDYEGDLLVLTTDGLYPMSKYMQSARLEAKSAVTYLISTTISQLVDVFANTPGFEMTIYPGQNVMLLNVPQTDQNNNFQYVFNTITKGWTQFTGWGARTFGVFNDALYFGGKNFVALAFIGYADGADINGVGGDNIVATALTAYNAMESGPMPSQGNLRHAKLVKPYIITGQANPTIRIGVNTDFSLVPLIGSATVNPITGAVWDNAIWDDPGATWVGSLTTFNQWATPLCYPGAYMALALSVSATSDLTWTATNWLVSPCNTGFG